MLMKIIRLITLFFAFGLTAQASPLSGGGDFQVLGYHAVREDLTTMPDRYTVTVSQLVQHFSWLRGSGYNVISVDQILAARNGGKPLPDKAVLLSFDDGFQDFRDNVFPLLKAFNYPAVLALVGNWMETADGESVPYGDGNYYTREDFISWSDLREMVASGLVEVASHSYDLHRGELANPQGNTFPAAVTRIYTPERGYETEQDYRQRILNDLKRNNTLIKKHLGKSPRIMVWPYGRYNETTLEVARLAGMPITFTLDGGINTPEVGLDRIRRFIVSHDLTIGGLSWALRPPVRPPILRVMHIDLDYVYDDCPEQTEKNLSLLLDRVREMHISTVYLQAFADPDGNGAADALYFPNRHLPMRANLFARVAWQLQTRAEVSVYAWMPLLAFELPKSHPLHARVVETLYPGKAGYHRLSSFDEEVRKVISEIYEDLSRYAIFQGILFHDDATFSDFEDASQIALHYYSTNWKLPQSIEEIRADPATMERWSALKTQHLTEFSLELAKVVARNQPELRTARNLYARVVMQPESKAWFAQSLSDFLANYDTTAIMAMPFMEGESEPLPWLQTLVDTVAAHPDGLSRTVFELQSFDWAQSNKPIPASLLVQKMRLLQTSGAVHFGYYPDDFHQDHPPMKEIMPYFSLRNFPYKAGRR